MSSLSPSAKETLSLISEKGEVEVGEIQDRFGMNGEAVYTITYLLVNLGLAEWDKDRKRIRLSRAYKKFLEE